MGRPPRVARDTVAAHDVPPKGFQCCAKRAQPKDVERVKGAAVIHGYPNARQPVSAWRAPALRAGLTISPREARLPTRGNLSDAGMALRVAVA